LSLLFGTPAVDWIAGEHPGLPMPIFVAVSVIILTSLMACPISVLVEDGILRYSIGKEKRRHLKNAMYSEKLKLLRQRKRRQRKRDWGLTNQSILRGSEIPG